MLTAITPNIVQQNGLLAGDSILKQSWLRPISLSMFHWQTHDQWISWSKKADSMKAKYGYGIEQWFLSIGLWTNSKMIRECQSRMLSQGLV